HARNLTTHPHEDDPGGHHRGAQGRHPHPAPHRGRARGQAGSARAGARSVRGTVGGRRRRIAAARPDRRTMSSQVDTVVGVQGQGQYRVFVDANVWYSRALRDWFGMLYTKPDTPPFAVYWTEDVLAELVYHLRREHPDWPGRRITRIRDLMAGTFEAG